MLKSLAQFAPGESGIIREIHTETDYEARLRDYGMVVGTPIVCRYHSPGHHLLALECRGAVIALRKRDIENILVEI